MNKNNDKGMTEIVKTVTSIIESVIFVYGVNIILYGHLSPGGGFAGGVILAFLFVLLFISFGKEDTYKKFNLSRSHIIESAGFLGILILFSLRFFLGGERVYNFFNRIYPGPPFRILSAGPMIFENMFIALKVGFAVFIAFAVLSVFSREEK